MTDVRHAIAPGGITCHVTEKAGEMTWRALLEDYGL